MAKEGAMLPLCKHQRDAGLALLTQEQRETLNQILIDIRDDFRADHDSWDGAGTNSVWFKQDAAICTFLLEKLGDREIPTSCNC